MNDDFVIALEGMAATRTLESLPKNIFIAAQRAINRVADSGATKSRRIVRDQVNFKAQYLTGTDSSGKPRLGVSKKASADSLEAVVTGRHRPTSLATFSTGSRTPGKAGVTVEVAPGFAKFMKRAFLIRLPAGRGNTDSPGNLGLAIRLKPNEKIQNKRVMQQLSGNLYLLYGPSIDQIFPSAIDEITPELQDQLGTEFIRLLDLNL